MRSFSELSKSLGRASSTRTSKRPSILPEGSGGKDADAKETSGDTLAVPTGEENKPTKTRSADDLFATFDALTRPPSQDISRPFDAVPAPRVSDANSISKRKAKNRRSLVPAAAPTVDTLQVSLTPFGDAFKSFVQEPQPPAITTTKNHPSPSISAIPSLTSNTTLDDVSFNTLLSPPHSRNVSASAAQTAGDGETTRASQTSPTPRARRTSVFKGMLGVMFIKDKVSTYWQPTSARELRSSGPTPPTSPIPSTTVNPVSDDKDANSLTRGLGSFRRLGRRSKEMPTSPTTATAPANLEPNPNGTALVVKFGEDGAVLAPPAPVGAISESGRGSPVSMKYSHGVLLHPVPEEDMEVAAQ